MKTWTAAAFVLGLAPAAWAAEPDFSSPYDTNRRCAERTTDAKSPECLVKDDAGPVVVRPPVVSPQTPSTPKTPATPAPTRSVPREGVAPRGAGG
jgi:hypothetical protein